MEKITKKERAVYEFVLDYRARMHFSPSMREIASGVGLYSVSTVHKHVSALVEKGLFLPYSGKKRMIIPREEAEEAHSDVG